MLSRFAYRQFHDQTNIAATMSVLLAEFGLMPLDTSQAAAGTDAARSAATRRLSAKIGDCCLRNALRHLSVAGLKWVSTARCRPHGRD